MSGAFIKGAPIDRKRIWAEFVKAVGASARPAGTPSRGELVIMGTGLGGSDLLPDVRTALTRADVVFYCLADVITQVMIQRQREDAIDLSIFYEASKPRYTSYVQMAEVMVQPAREGKRVLSLYYGHPGIFATPTHRAMAIARSEGIRSRMRPGISALDYLIADVGFDPAYPGLLSYEATDMLLRGRRLDPSVHVVLWQIGLVGELGHNRRGYANDRFELLLDRIADVYGETEVVHYIGSRFPAIPPLIERMTTSALRKPAARVPITALSTMYIPPTQAITGDVAAATALGLQTANASPSTFPAVLDLARYGPLERSAIDDLSGFDVPSDYTLVEETPAVRLMLDLHGDPSLQEIFELDPAAVLSRDEYSDMATQARDLLIRREIKAAHWAMYQKGLHTRDTGR